MKHSGKLITFEGPDGAGKTTQIQLTARALEQSGYLVATTREPGGTRLSEAIRQLLLDPCYREMSSLTEALLYTGARSQLVSEVILPALTAGKVVLCDRFVDSSIAYQGYGRGLDLEMLRVINSFVLSKLGAFCTILLDLPAEEGLERSKGNIERDRLEQESLSFRQRVREGYLILARTYPERIKVVDASADPRLVQEQIQEYVMAYLTGRDQGGVFW
ncbi:MAG: dTMP kinase [Syntrophaceticus sp.]